MAEEISTSPISPSVAITTNTTNTTSSTTITTTTTTTTNATIAITTPATRTPTLSKSSSSSSIRPSKSFSKQSSLLGLSPTQLEFAQADVARKEEVHKAKQKDKAIFAEKSKQPSTDQKNLSIVYIRKRVNRIMGSKQGSSENLEDINKKNETPQVYIKKVPKKKVSKKDSKNQGDEEDMSKAKAKSFFGVTDSNLEIALQGELLRAQHREIIKQKKKGGHSHYRITFKIARFALW